MLCSIQIPVSAIYSPTDRHLSIAATSFDPLAHKTVAHHHHHQLSCRVFLFLSEPFLLFFLFLLTSLHQEMGGVKLGFLIVCSTNFIAFFHLESSEARKQVMA
jgi:hypothetical protein